MAATDLIAILQQTGGIAAIANQLGIPPAMAEAGASALLPAIVGGLSKQAESFGLHGLLVLHVFPPLPG